MRTQDEMGLFVRHLAEWLGMSYIVMASWVICLDCLWKYDMFTTSLFTPGNIYTIVQLSFMVDINGIKIKIVSTIVVSYLL